MNQPLNWTISCRKNKNISTRKTQIMMAYKVRNLEVQDYIIEQVMSFKYLGIEINNGGS